MANNYQLFIAAMTRIPAVPGYHRLRMIAFWIAQPWRHG
jgi:hypothetical protein